MISAISFTHLVTVGALANAVVGLVALAVVRVVTRERLGSYALVVIAALTGVVAMLQVTMADDGFGKLHVLYLWVFVTLPVVGGAVLLAGLVPALRPTRWGLIGGGALLALGAVGFYGTHVEPRWLRTEHVRLEVDGVDGRPLRVGVLSDLQTADVGDYERDAIRRLVDEEPDLILVAGDIFQSDGPTFEAALPELRELLAGLEAPGGVFLVEGDVDSPHRMAMMTEGQDLTWLDHEVATTTVRGTTVAVGGVSPRYASAESRATVDALASTDADVRLLLSHRPDVADEVPDDGVDLLVTGHTHGGQVQLPFIGPPITMSGVPRIVAAGGLHEIDGLPVYLSTGVGLERHTAPQVRLLTRPSVGVVTLT